MIEKRNKISRRFLISLVFVIFFFCTTWFVGLSFDSLPIDIDLVTKVGYVYNASLIMLFLSVASFFYFCVLSMIDLHHMTHKERKDVAFKIRSSLRYGRVAYSVVFLLSLAFLIVSILGSNVTYTITSGVIAIVSFLKLFEYRALLSG